jgi:hypothetical protein
MTRPLTAEQKLRKLAEEVRANKKAIRGRSAAQRDSIKLAHVADEREALYITLREMNIGDPAMRGYIVIAVAILNLADEIRGLHRGSYRRG